MVVNGGIMLRYLLISYISNVCIIHLLFLVVMHIFSDNGQIGIMF